MVFRVLVATFLALAFVSEQPASLVAANAEEPPAVAYVTLLGATGNLVSVVIGGREVAREGEMVRSGRSSDPFTGENCGYTRIPASVRSCTGVACC